MQNTNQPRYLDRLLASYLPFEAEVSGVTTNPLVNASVRLEMEDELRRRPRQLNPEIELIGCDGALYGRRRVGGEERSYLLRPLRKSDWRKLDYSDEVPRD